VCRQARVDLDGDDVRSGFGKVLGQTAVAGTDLEDEVARTNACVADEIGRERATAEEVLTTTR
jgi:hypothetical protein